MKSLIPIIVFYIALTSCEKQYRVRVSNYSMQKLDSVVIGSHRVTFADVAIDEVTGYQPITSGQHSVRFVCGDQIFTRLASIEKNTGPDFTIQLDGLRQVEVFQDN